MNIEQATEEIERRFAGGLVSAESRPGGLLASLRVPIAPNDLLDPMARAITGAAMIAEDPKWNMLPTPENLALIIRQNNLLDSPPDHANLMSAITDYSEAGISNPGGLHMLAIGIRDAVSNRRLMEYGRKVSQLVSDGSATAPDKYAELSAALEAVRPENIEAKIYTVKDQVRIMREMKRQQQELIRQEHHLMTFPPQWGVDEGCTQALEKRMRVAIALVEIRVMNATFSRQNGYSMQCSELNGSRERRNPPVSRWQG